jgi:arylsulfatase A-like enzyme
MNRPAADGATESARNVVLVCLDTVRKNVFDELAPRLRELSDVSVPQCRATSNWSAPSHAGMFTGRLPHQHGVHAGSPSFSELAVPTVLDDMPDHATFGVSANPYANSTYGFDAFFDEFVDVDDYSRYPDGLDVREFVDGSGDPSYLSFLRASLGHDRRLESLANGVLSVTTRLSEPLPVPRLFDHGAKVVRRETVRAAEDLPEPFFGFLNFMDAHTPLQHVRGFDRDLHDVPNTWMCTTDRYNPWDVVEDLEGHEQYLEYRRALYAAAVDYLDRQVAALIEDVRAATDRETTFLVTADHGENLGTPEDRNLVMHKGSLTEGLLHVPFCVVGAPGPPDAFDRAARDDDRPYLSHLALPAVIRAAAAGDPLPTAAFTRRAPAEVVGLNGLTDASEIDDYERWDRMIRAAYDGSTKVVWDSLGAVDEYRIDFDTPSVDRHVGEPDAPPPWATDLFDVGIDEYKAGVSAGDAAVDDATRDRLRDLGYV